MGRLTLNREWEKKAEQLFKAFGQELSSGPSAYAQSLIALDFAIGPSREIVLAGQKDDPQTQEMLKSLYSRFIPNKVVIFRPASEEEAMAIFDIIPFVKGQPALSSKTTAYVCTNYNCKFPTDDIDKFNELLEDR